MIEVGMPVPGIRGCPNLISGSTSAALLFLESRSHSLLGNPSISSVHLLHALEQLRLQFELAVPAEVEVLARRLNKHVRAVSKKTIVGERMIGPFDLSEIVDSDPDSTKPYAMEVAKRREYIQLDQVLKRQIRWIGRHDGWPELLAGVGHIARAHASRIAPSIPVA